MFLVKLVDKPHMFILGFRVNQLLFYAVILLVISSPLSLCAEESSDIDLNAEVQQGFDSLLVSLKDPQLLNFEKTVIETVAMFKQSGYRNAPDISLKLLTFTEAFKDKKKERLKIIWAAKDLSPSHPEVLISVSSYVWDIGFRQSIEFFLEGIRYLPEYPFTSVSLAIKLTLMLIYGLIISVLLTMFGNLTFSSSEVLSFISGFFVKEMRAFYSGVVLVGLLICPLIFPVLYVAIIWSVFCAYASSRMRWAPLFTASAICGLIMFVPLAENILDVSGSKIGRALENSRSNNFVHNVEELLTKAIKKDRDSVLLKVLSGQLAHFSGNEVSAQESYKFAIAEGGDSPGLNYVVESNLAQIDFQEGNQDGAYERWKLLYDQGWREYELLVNLAIASVSLYKKSEYETYFAELNSNYKSSKLVMSSDVKPLVARIPASSLLSLLWSQDFSPRLKSGHYLPSQTQSLRFLEGVSANYLLGFSIILFVWGIILIKENTGRYRFRASSTLDRAVFKASRFELLRTLPLVNLLSSKKEFAFFLNFACFYVPTSTLFLLPLFVRSSSIGLAHVSLAFFFFVGFIGILFRSQSKQEIR